MDFLLRHGHIVIFVAVFIEQIGLPVPSGAVLLAAGALVGFHRPNLAHTLALALAASLICDSLWFALGRRRGGSVLRFVCQVSIEPDTCVSKTHSAYLRYGPESLLISKFLTWFGTLGPPMAGMFNLGTWRFLLTDAAGALLWAGSYIGCGWLFRKQLEDVATASSRFGSTIGIVICAGLVAFLAFRFVRLLQHHRAYRSNRMTPGELKQRIDAGEPLVVVRPAAGFRASGGLHPRSHGGGVPESGFSAAGHWREGGCVLLLLSR